MPMAYVLLNTKIDSKNNLLEEIRQIDGVKEAFNLWGIYDIIARIQTDTIENLTNIINNKLETSNIHSKLTVMVAEPTKS
jgi:DNA-binding Lrp family transcriptional regulator